MKFNEKWVEFLAFMAFLIVGCVVMLWGMNWLQSQPKDNATSTDYARIGIEAGLNACILRGAPTNRKELDDAREQARVLVEKMYPEVKFHWPVIIKHDELRQGTPEA